MSTVVTGAEMLVSFGTWKLTWAEDTCRSGEGVSLMSSWISPSVVLNGTLGAWVVFIAPKLPAGENGHAVASEPGAQQGCA